MGYHRTNIIKIEIDRELLEAEKQKLMKKEVSTTIVNTLPEEVLEKIFNDIKEKIRLSDTLVEAQKTLIVMILITGLVQGGGTNKVTAQGMNFVYGEYTLNSKYLLDLINKYRKNSTIRQLARSLADEIAEIAINLDMEGDLANQMRMDHPEITPEQAAWCSNFQTTNPNCPIEVRNWLVNNYRNRFNR
jgi:hypothetical protein